ncbi:exocyst complex component Sec10-like protein [Dipodascopsis uninucleata]
MAATALSSPSPSSSISSRAPLGSRGRLRKFSSLSILPILPVSKDKERLILSPLLYATILGYLPIGDFIHCARVCRAFRQIVYDDAHWMYLLRQMDVWDDEIADSFIKSANRRNAGREAIQRGLTGKSITAFNVLSTVHSVPGYARHEFSRVYAYLAPIYFQITKPGENRDSRVIHSFRAPEQQALVLRALLQFSNAPIDDHYEERRQRLLGIVEIFENAALREFEAALEEKSFSSDARRYATVLTMLNGGNTAMQAFVQYSLVRFGLQQLNGKPSLQPENLNTLKQIVDPFKSILDMVSNGLEEHEQIIRTVFAADKEVAKSTLLIVTERIIEDVLGEYVSQVIQTCHDKCSLEIYLQVVSRLYSELLEFAYNILGPEDRTSDSKRNDLLVDIREFHLYVTIVIDRIYEQHVDVYFQEELEEFKRKCQTEVDQFDRNVTKQQERAESIVRNKFRESQSQFPDSIDRFDFLNAFKKVLFLPVVAISNSTPGSKFSITAGGSMSSRASSSFRDEISDKQLQQQSQQQHTSWIWSKEPQPTYELAASAAVLNSRLASIGMLFSLELALNLIKFARESIERISVFAQFGNSTGEEAKEQCQLVFVALLESLGFHHIQHGFDRALVSLTEYQAPRVVDIEDDDERADDDSVEPLITFLELVNVGDLITQMIDAFYEKELASRNVLKTGDFLSPAVKQKKKFEQMLDDRVASGLNRGIDVLIDQVDYILAKEQKTNEFNINNYTVHTSITMYVTSNHIIDSRLGPTKAALRVVQTVGTHTKLLNGNTDKTTLDVFLQEVGLRLYSSISKHIKRHKVAFDGGAVLLISDLNYYYQFVERTLRQRTVLPYFAALREISQLYLIDTESSKELGRLITVVVQKFAGIINAEDVLEFVQCRADWMLVKRDVEKAIYGLGLTDCTIC